MECAQAELDGIIGIGMAADMRTAQKLKGWIRENIRVTRSVAWTEEGRQLRVRSRSPKRTLPADVVGAGIEIPRHVPLGGRDGRPIVLLSLFDGLGTARLAVDELIREAGPSVYLAGSWYAEWYEPLRLAVDAAWHRRSAMYGCTRHLPVASDVWGMLRNNCTILRALLAQGPAESLFLIVGGSP